MTAIFIFLFAVFLVFAVVNQFDESINPAINELKKNDNHIVSKKSNAFYINRDRPQLIYNKDYGGIERFPFNEIVQDTKNFKHRN